MTILLISHDLQLMSQLVDRINVLYCGQTVESAEPDDLLLKPHHPYTQALMRAIPDFEKALAHKCRLNTLRARFRHWSICRSAAARGRAVRMLRKCVLTRRVCGQSKPQFCLSLPAEYGGCVMPGPLLEVKNLSKTFRYGMVFPPSSA